MSFFSEPQIILYYKCDVSMTMNHIFNRFRSPCHKERCWGTKREGEQVNVIRNPLHGLTVPKKRLKSRSSFMHEAVVQPSTVCIRQANADA